MARRLEPLSPPWWTVRLYAQLVARREVAQLHDRYYRGDHPLPWLAPAAREEFRRILKMTRSNYMGLVVDATAERLMVEGFRLGPLDQEADAETWRIYKANGLEDDLDQGILEALVTGLSYLLVEPNEDDQATPRICVESSTQAIVEYVPGTGRRVIAAGLKVWDDDWTDQTFATLYLPDAVFKYQAKRSKLAVADRMDWKPREVPGEQWGGPNRLREVPLRELENNPRLLTGGVSEIEDVTDIQDRINKTIADRLITQDYGAFPQKWISAWPSEDADGNPTPAVDIGRNRIVTSEVAETKFGQWDGAPLDPYSAAKREDVKDVASRTRTPAQYLLGEMNNVNGETLKASESGLISKVSQRQRGYAGGGVRGITGTMNLARKAAGLPDLREVLQVIWRNPAYRTEGELVDALTKMSTLHVPDEVLWEKWGATPEERARWKEMNAAQAMDPTMADIASKLGGLPPQGAPMMTPGQVASGAGPSAGGA